MELNQLTNKRVLDWIHNFNSKKEVILRITKYCNQKNLFYYKEDFKSSRLETNEYIDRKKINKCSNCRFINNCSGILKLYLEKYWEKEFNSIK